MAEHYLGTTVVEHKEVPIVEWKHVAEIERPVIGVNEHAAWFFFGEGDLEKAVMVDLEQYGSPLLEHLGKHVKVEVTHKLIGITESRVTNG